MAIEGSVISGLSELTSLDRTVDQFVVIDDSETDVTKKTKRISGENMLEGLVDGPASATNNAIVRFDGTDGKTLQDSAVIVDDIGNVNIPSGKTYDIGGVPHTHDYIPGFTIKSMYFGVAYHDVNCIDVNCSPGLNQGAISSVTLYKTSNEINFQLSSDGKIIYIKNGGAITGDFLGVISSSLQTCKANDDWYTVEFATSGTDKLMVFFTDCDGGGLDLTSVGADLFLDVLLTFVTT